MKTLHVRSAIGAALLSVSTGGIALADNPQSVDGGSVAPLAVAPPNGFVYESGAHFYKKALTYNKPQTTQSTSWTNLVPSFTRVPIPPGKSVLVNVRFTAESACYLATPASANGDPDWCLVRVLINGVPGEPSAPAPSTFAFDSTNRGTETDASWEGHAMDRHRCVTNTTNQTLNIPVGVQWSIQDFGADPIPVFWLDDWSLAIELADGCKAGTLP